jgi:SAM-dependent methyltransferase
MKLDYTPQYYRRLKAGAVDSAKAIVPAVVELIHPNSVVDLGCGTAAWLAEFKHCGVADIVGVDTTQVPVDELEISPEDFVTTDLTEPLQLQGYFDLAMSVEVAEHLPADKSDQFVKTLTRLAPVVLFSAAIPQQGGEHHINEQWPAYWVERFAANGFVALDPFRRLLWERKDVEWWYAQNLVLFVRREHLTRYPSLETVAEGIQSAVHPQNYLNHAWQNQVLRLAIDIATVTRPSDSVVLVDEDQFGELYLPGRDVRPFIERHGAYFGPPGHDAEAIEEIQRMIREGAMHLAVGWPAFWWLKYYNEFARYLDENHYTILKNERVVMYRLQS